MMRQRELVQLFLAFRSERPILFLSGKGWSFLTLPALVQPKWDPELNFLKDISWLEEGVKGLPFTRGWVGFLSYEQGMDWLGIVPQHPARLPKQVWRYCDRGIALSPDGEMIPFGGLSIPSVLPILDINFQAENFHFTLSKEFYLKRLQQIREALFAGETYQVNFAHELQADFLGDPLALYLQLFERNPASMTVYMEEEDFVICSNSPERLVSLTGRQLIAEPIKGTIPKDSDPELLLKDEKSDAELTMIVDLLRNDLGRVAEAGSVKVPVHRELMVLSSVIHTYSRIEAKLRSDLTVAEVLKSVFPGGSVTGCPKKRTMEWINRLENFPRGAYCGSMGYISESGHADFNILIRTAVLQNQKLFYATGGGIVVDSNAEMEYQETLHKAATLAQVLKCPLLEV